MSVDSSASTCSLTCTFEVCVILTGAFCLTHLLGSIPRGLRSAGVRFSNMSFQDV
jgi:hypothetical protein